MTAIRVAHPGADYEVLVGDLAEAMPHLLAAAKGQRLPVVSDRRVLALHGALLADLALGDPILVPEGESAKDWQTLADVVNKLASLAVTRETPVIAFGGGSVGDVAALAASLFKRGCPVIHLPTTLLAQADSAIGGKTAIDAAGQKNLVGSFHHPLLVVTDPALLDSLDSRQLRSGYAEVVKYGLIDDPDFFAWCEANGGGLLAGNRSLRQVAIEHCVRAKARFVGVDPNDTGGVRALLNFGHTFGHAVEAVAGHAVLHGEAVAIGMVLALAYSVELGLCPPDDAERARSHLENAGLPSSVRDLGLAGEASAILNAMLVDKKSSPDGLTLILARGIGKAFVAERQDRARLADFLERSA
jgi:3-dehydroquinate synthase